jgi:amino acid adenylation domain-containing protein
MLELLSHLRSEGVVISVDGAALKISAPKGVLTPELRQELSERKPDIIEFLRSSREASRTGNRTITRLDRNGSSLPLSFSQQRLWFLHQLDSESSVYNIPVAIKLSGTLDSSALENALAAIVERHEILKTCFIRENSEPRTIVRTDMQWHLEKKKLESQTADLDAEISRQTKSFAGAPFDLTRGPLFRARLLEIDQDTHILLLSMHHIISDGWSMGIIVHELADYYKAFLLHGEARSEALTIQYADFADWQRKWLESGELERQLPYWQETLAGSPPIVQFPPDHPRPKIESFHGCRSLLVLPASLVKELEQFSRSEGVTLFMVLLAIFKVLIYRYSGQQDVVIGTPSANRSRAELNPLIGFFVNNLVLRTKLNGNPTFRELLGRIRDVTLGAYDHQDVPFDKLVQTLRPERTLGHSPLFQTMFIFQNFPFDELELPGLKISLIPIDIGIARFDFTIEIIPRLGEFHAYFEYNTDLYAPETVAAMQNHFVGLIKAAIADPSLRIDDLPLLSKEEERHLIEDFNQTARSIPEHLCFHHRFEEQARQIPASLAVTTAHESLTYRELNDRANCIAHCLSETVISADSLVAVCIERSADLLAALLATMKTGAAYVPLDPIYPKHRISMILEDAQPGVILTSQSLRHLFEDSSATIICVDSISEQPQMQKTSNPARTVLQDSLAYVIFTSGSTGRPKGVQITHRALINFLESMSSVPGFTVSDTMLAVTTVSFDIAALELYLPLYVGGRVHIALQPGNAESLLVDFDSVRPTVMQATPATWQLLLSMGWSGSSNLKILCGGEALDAELARSLLACSNSLWNMYGPTETTIWSTALRLDELKDNIVPIGYPIQNTSLFLLDASRKLVPVGVAGELHIGGAGLARGYLGRPDLTTEKFIPHPFSDQPGDRLYRTGDLARYRHNGTLEFLGRIDHQVKLRGFRIELGEIEHVLRKQAAIQDAVVLLREDGGDKRLVAYLIGEESSSATIRETLRKELPEYMIPSASVFLRQFPRTPNGKLDRAAFPEPDRHGIDGAFVAPSNPTQNAIAEVFRELLHLETVGVHDNFFDLGAHSLLVVKAHESLRNRIDPELLLIHFFQYPTIETLASFIERHAESRLVTASGSR